VTIVREISSWSANTRDLFGEKELVQAPPTYPETLSVDKRGFLPQKWKVITQIIPLASHRASFDFSCESRKTDSIQGPPDLGTHFHLVRSLSRHHFSSTYLTTNARKVEQKAHVVTSTGIRAAQFWNSVEVMRPQGLHLKPSKELHHCFTSHFTKD
jgi:hypothetical protein